MHIEDQRKVSSDNELRSLSNMIAFFSFLPFIIVGLGLVFSNSVDRDSNVVIYGALVFIFGLFLSLLLKAFADVIYLLKKIADK